MNLQKTYLSLLLLLFFFLFAFIANAQNDSLIYFFDKNMNSCTRDEAYYVGIATKKDSLWHFDNYVNETEVKIANGFYRDSLLKIPQGFFQYFSDDGKILSEGAYKNGKETGLWKRWDKEGNLIDSIFYNNGNISEEYSWSYYQGNLRQFAYTNNKTKERRSVEYHDGKLLRESSFEDKDGEMKEYYQNGQVSVYQKFVKNKIVETKNYDEDGNMVSPEKIKSKLPQFPGGEGAFQRWIDNELKIPKEIRESVHFNSTATVTFTLDEHGKVNKIFINGISNDDLTLYLQHKIQQMPNWLMFGFKTWTFTLTLRII